MIRSPESVWAHLSIQSPEEDSAGNACVHNNAVATAGPNAVCSVIWHSHRRDGPQWMLATPIKVRQEISRVPWNFLCSKQFPRVGYSWQLPMSKVQKELHSPNFPGVVWHHPSATDSTKTNRIFFAVQAYKLGSIPECPWRIFIL